MIHTLFFNFTTLQCKLKGPFKFELKYYEKTLEKMHDLSDELFMELSELFKRCEQGVLFEYEFYDTLDSILRNHNYLSWPTIPVLSK
jgi:hypothetical protein